MRSKEEAHDYRYFPEPDLPPLVVNEARVAAVRGSMPELPERASAFRRELGLPAYDAGVLPRRRGSRLFRERSRRVQETRRRPATG